jgi:hypothetical protein
MAANRVRRARGFFVWGTVLLVGGVLLAAVGITGIIAKTGGGIRDDLRAPVVATPAAFTRDLTPGTYLVYELTGTSDHFGPVTTSRDTGVTLTPDRVDVTAPSGAAVPVSYATADETLTRGRSTYTGAVRFVVDSPGAYRVAVTAPDLQVVVAPSIVSAFSRALAWLGLIASGGLIAVFGGVLLIVGVVRGRRKVAAAPPGGWFTDPWGRAQLRWWDGRGWTDHTS